MNTNACTSLVAHTSSCSPGRTSLRDVACGSKHGMKLSLVESARVSSSAPNTALAPRVETKPKKVTRAKVEKALDGVVCNITAIDNWTTEMFDAIEAKDPKEAKRVAVKLLGKLESAGELLVALREFAKVVSEG